MKKYIIVLAALAAVACAKNNVPDPAPAGQTLKLTVSDFPALESATKSGEVYGKTAWEDGDELLIMFTKHADGGNIFTDNENTVSTIHLATYSDGEWTLDVPIIISESDLSNSCLQICYRQGLKWDKDNLKVVTSDGQEPTVAQLMQSESLTVYNFVRSMDHTITFNKIVDDNGQLVSSIIDRANRVRIHYNDSDPSTRLYDIKVSQQSGDVLYALDRYTYRSYNPQDIWIPLDENNEAIVYLYWEFGYEQPPVLEITTTFEQEIALPYGENDHIDAPYPFDEYDFTNPIFSEDGYSFPYHSNAYAYSVVVN